MADTDIKQRIIIYIDGFNFYNGMKATNWKKFYWLDLFSFFEKFISDNQEIVKIKYFSAHPNHEGKKKRQGIYFSANKLNPKFELFLGSFLDKDIDCSICKASFKIKEEKKTDVNIATQLIADCINNNCDISILVSGDSDLTPPIKFIKSHNPKHIVNVFFPPSRVGQHLKTICHNSISLENYKSRFKSSQFPNEILLESGHKLIKPSKWI